MRLLSKALPAAVLLLLAGCAHGGGTVTGDKDAASVARTRKLVAEVSKLRGLPEKSPVRIDVQDGAAFKRLVRQDVDDDLTPEDVSKELARWVAFGLVPANVDLKRMLEEIYGDEVAGFYSPKTKTLHVPSRARSLTDDMILAHEIEHSLQDQNFGIPDLDAADDDTQLASAALFEGDATFVMMDWALAHNPHAPPGTTADAIVDVARELQQAPTNVLIGLTGKSDMLLSAPPIVRESMLFPYFAGLHFVAELYHRGGYALVNDLFRAPPVSTRQILHPETYLAGERPTPIDDIPIPKGETLAARGHLGELAIRTMFADCVGAAQAAKATDGWAGDAFLVTRRPDHALALYWTTTWETPADAAVFAHVMESLAACWKTASGLPGQAISADTFIVPDGSNVAIVRGVPDTSARKVVRPLLAAVRPALPLAPPISAAELAAAKPPARTVDHEHGRIQNGVWINDWYGLRVPIPADFNATTRTPGVPLQCFRKRPDMAGLTLAVVGGTDDASSRETTFKAFHDTVANMLGPQAKITPLADTPLQIDHVASVQRRWAIVGAFSGISATAIPVCGGRGYVLVGQFWQHPEDAPLLDGWLRKIQVVPGAYCASLGPAEKE